LIIQLTGAQILMKVLAEEGVETVFGFPGGAVIDIYHELVKTDIQHVLVRHEQGAVHAADGYARAAGKVGVCLVTSGPGATNTVSGIASAFMDSVPVVVITGQVPTHLIGNDAFQEVDIVGITRSCTKHNYLVTNVDELSKTLREAFHIARTGRPGPVLVDLPKDVMAAKTAYNPPEPVRIKSYRPNYEPNCKQLPRAIELIKGAERPLVFSGGGVILSRASEELRRLAEAIDSPVTSTLMGLGAFPASDPRWLGMIGMHGTYRANMASAECDLLIAVGVRFDDRVTGRTEAFAPKAKIVHIDIDPTSIRKTIPVTVPIVGDCRITLEKLNHLLAQEDFRSMRERRREWFERIAGWKAAGKLAYEQKETIKPQYVVETLYSLTQGEAIITTEVGQNQMWAAQYYHFDRPNSFITSGGLGCMGFGLPAAIGAQTACPDRLVVDIAGDGQRLPGDGAAVGGVVLRSMLCLHGDDPFPGFRETGRGLRCRGVARHTARRGETRAGEGAGREQTGYYGFSGRTRRRGLSHGAGRGGYYRDAPCLVLFFISTVTYFQDSLTARLARGAKGAE